jgi:hypoxanthine phosphoribosyltransferase
MPADSVVRTDQLETLFSAEQIARRRNELVEEMAPDLHRRDLIMIGVLRGSFVFLADLVRDLYDCGIHTRIDFITLESYYDRTVSSGAVHIAKDCSIDVSGQTILIVDDILDTGRTLRKACEHLQARGAQTTHTCVLLDKPSRRVVSCRADYVGFTVPNRFVVGYGLDYDGRYRELPFIATLPDEETPSAP